MSVSSWQASPGGPRVRLLLAGQPGPYLTANHDVGHLGLAIIALHFVIASADREDEISRVALALSYEEAAMLSLFGQ